LGIFREDVAIAIYTVFIRLKSALSVGSVKAKTARGGPGRRLDSSEYFCLYYAYD
jgi:hypothetical protein